MPDHFDGKGNWPQYLAHFENVAVVNNWDSHEKAQYLGVSLRGEACQTSQLLDPEMRSSYHALVTALAKRFHPQHNRDLYRTQIRARVRKEKESLPHLAQSIRTMALEAYPTADNELFESLCCDHFLDSLIDDDLKMHLLRTESQTLDEVLSHAIKFESHLQARKLKPNLNKRYVREISRVDRPEDLEPLSAVECNAVQRENSNSNRAQDELLKCVKTLAESQEKVLSCVQSMAQNQEQALDKISNSIKSLAQSQDRRKPYQDKKPEFGCYECGELGHARPKCPNRKGDSTFPSPC